MIDAVKGRAGLFPETKSPGVYGGRGFDMERLVLDILKKNGLDAPLTPETKTPVIIQSFSPASLQRLVSYRTRVPLVLLVGNENASRLTAGAMRDIRQFAEGIGPDKNILLGKPEIVKWAHAAGLSVTAWTFRESGKTGFATVKEEMAFFLNEMNIDALFTDNPDCFPR
jgi:glycerophosphoryl diester phosphodiesterase